MSTFTGRKEIIIQTVLKEVILYLRYEKIQFFENYEYPRLSRGRPGFNSPTRRIFLIINFTIIDSVAKILILHTQT